MSPYTLDIAICGFASALAIVAGIVAYHAGETGLAWGCVAVAVACVGITALLMNLP